MEAARENGCSTCTAPCRVVGSLSRQGTAREQIEYLQAAAAPVAVDISTDNDDGGGLRGVSEGSSEYFARVGSRRRGLRERRHPVQCRPCTLCYAQADPLFDPAASALAFAGRFRVRRASTTSIGLTGLGVGGARLPLHWNLGDDGGGGVVMDTGTALFDTCYDLSGYATVRVPTVALTLPARNLLVAMDDHGVFEESASGLSIVGNIQQQGNIHRRLCR
ncbi:hypothetical protein QYE76_009012 [Lolium multiflorum]|uniref:Peptidase A1 domain-containing protein n=1 Tax=Lolium multiflorum TaxID=4521 RepID=A0AAD8X1I7_LOLMU|nr:hypothetical protein QYE76_009012 [Lolium multiflorum]